MIASPALQTLAGVRPVADRDGSSAEALRRMLAELWVHLRSEAIGSILKLAIAEARRFPEIMSFWLHAVVKPARATIAEVVLQGVDRNEFRQIDPDVVAHSLLLPMFMSCLPPYVTPPGTSADRCLDEEASLPGRATLEVSLTFTPAGPPTFADLVQVAEARGYRVLKNSLPHAVGGGQFLRERSR